jgi:hypothetical protein
MINVIIKGDPQTAAAAALDRGIPALWFIRYIEARNQTVAKVGHDHADKLVAWFSEPAQVKTGQGFPDGTLLLFNEPQTRTTVGRPEEDD